jgi:hypothetical protein
MLFFAFNPLARSAGMQGEGSKIEEEEKGWRQHGKGKGKGKEREEKGERRDVRRKRGGKEGDSERGKAETCRRVKSIIITQIL